VEDWFTSVPPPQKKEMLGREKQHHYTFQVLTDATAKASSYCCTLEWFPLVLNTLFLISYQLKCPLFVPAFPEINSGFVSKLREEIEE
jgi:hypothetical protein